MQKGHTGTACGDVGRWVHVQLLFLQDHMLDCLRYVCRKRVRIATNPKSRRWARQKQSAVTTTSRQDGTAAQFTSSPRPGPHLKIPNNGPQSSRARPGRRSVRATCKTWSVALESLPYRTAMVCQFHQGSALYPYHHPGHHCLPSVPCCVAVGCKRQQATDSWRRARYSTESERTMVRRLWLLRLHSGWIPSSCKVAMRARWVCSCATHGLPWSMIRGRMALREMELVMLLDCRPSSISLFIKVHRGESGGTPSAALPGPD